jgi:hypothetical protein
MAETHTKVREVAWSELFPWLMLLRSVRIALMARVLVLGAVGLIATAIGWTLLTEAFSRSTDTVVTTWRQNTSLKIWSNSVRPEGEPFWVNTSAHSAEEIFESAHVWLVRAPVRIWTYFARPFVAMFEAKSPAGFLFLLLCGVWELLVWGLIGGAITRIAALKFTRDEAPGLLAALKHSFSKWPSYSLPPLVALAGASLFAIQLVVLGLFMRVEVLAFLAALVWPFALLLGLMIAVLLIGALIGWPLMWATVSVEGTDAFDALSRSYAYVYHRPWRLLWYAMFALFLAVVSMFVVKLFASSAISLANWSIDWGLDDTTMHRVVSPEAPPNTAPKLNLSVGDNASVDIATPDASSDASDLGRTLSATKSIIDFWKAIVALLVAGYQAGFLWVAAVGIYLLLRRDIDGVQTSEVFVDQAEEYGMPPLIDDPSTGIPEVAPSDPAVQGDTGMQPS